MGSKLAAIGRAQPSRSVLQFLQAKNSIEQNERRNQLTAADLAMSSEQLAQLKRQGEYQEKIRQEGERPLAVETFSAGFEGGPDGPMFKMVYDMADKAGFIDKSTGGLGTVKKRHFAEIGQMMNESNFAMKLSRTRIDYWRGKLNESQSVLKEKPTDQKALQAFQQASAGLNQAIGQDASAMAAMKQQTEQTKADADLVRAGNEQTPEEILRDKKDLAKFKESIKTKDRSPVTVSNIEARILDQVVNAGRPVEDLTKEEKRVYDRFFSKGQSASKTKPEFYEDSLANGFTAIREGADASEVYNRLAEAFPTESKELKAVLFYPQTLPEDVKIDLTEAVEAINEGAKRPDVYTKIASKHPRYRKELRSILITPTTEDTLQALITLLD